jgi:hypothetical protein
MGFSQVVVLAKKMLCRDSIVPISKVGQSSWWTLAGFVASPLHQFLNDFGI